MRNILAGLVLTLLTLIGAPILLVCMLFGLRDAFLAYGYWMMKVGRLILGIDLDVAGLGRLDRQTPCVFMSNHLSFLDAPLLVTVIDRLVRFVVKRFVFRVPVLGLGMRFAGYVPLDKEGVGEGRKRIARAVELIRARGYSFLVYPEGTRSPEGKLLPFRRGGFFLAIDAGATIVAVTIKGTYELMPRGARRIRKGRVRIVFHEPIAVSGYTAETMPELMERVRAAIASAL
ncbi:MAG: 1-acyl-sn-glycerol-3-phosphate acyltransferase [Candidatus Aminicenantes bacterium]|nr:1-acyl-sn-glycerol-3-phosphate acyltransferase [Candidatus Aminicenantes bacterium]